MNKELNVARVLKQPLSYILEENDFVLTTTNFRVTKPQIDDEYDYLYNEHLRTTTHSPTLKFRR